MSRRYANLSLGLPGARAGSSLGSRTRGCKVPQGPRPAARANVGPSGRRAGGRSPPIRSRSRTAWVSAPGRPTQATFGELAVAAQRNRAARPEPKLKDPDSFKLIGKHVPRLDSPAKTTGKAIYTLDKTVPGMLVAVVGATPPKFGAKVDVVRRD